MEATLKRARRDAVMQIIALSVLVIALARDAKLFLLRHDLDVLWLKTRDRERDAVAAFTLPKYVEWRLAIILAQARFEYAEQPIKTEVERRYGAKSNADLFSKFSNEVIRA